MKINLPTSQFTGCYSNTTDSQNRFKFEVLITFWSPSATEIALTLIEALRRHRISYFLDSEQTRWGDCIQNKVEEGLSMSRHELVIITEHSLRRPLTRLKLLAALHQQLSNGDSKLLPMLAGTMEQQAFILQELPLLREFRYVKWDNNGESIAQMLKKQSKHQ